MFPKFNLSRFSSLAALGIFAAVLGGCAESTSGMRPASEPLLTRAQVSIARPESEVQLLNSRQPSAQIGRAHV